MKGSILNLLCVIIICATCTLCVLIYSEYNRFKITTTKAFHAYKLDKKTGDVWSVYRRKVERLVDPTHGWTDEEIESGFRFTDETAKTHEAQIDYKKIIDADPRVEVVDGELVIWDSAIEGRDYTLEQTKE